MKDGEVAQMFNGEWMQQINGNRYAVVVLQNDSEVAKELRLVGRYYEVDRILQMWLVKHGYAIGGSESHGYGVTSMKPEDIGTVIHEKLTTYEQVLTWVLEQLDKDIDLLHQQNKSPSLIEQRLAMDSDEQCYQAWSDGTYTKTRAKWSIDYPIDKRGSRILGADYWGDLVSISKEEYERGVQQSRLGDSK